MKLLFNLEVVAGSRIRARPGAYLRSLPPAGQLAAVSEFLHRAANEAADNSDPQARAGAEIVIATAREFLQPLQSDTPLILAGKHRGESHD